jgi:hypothetical protein
MSRDSRPRGNSVNDFFRYERHAGGNLFSFARDQAHRAEVFVSFLCLGGRMAISPLLVILNRTFMMPPSQS